jgi:voltage-gated potassium channel Kch
VAYGWSFAGVYRSTMYLQGIARHRGFAALLVAWLTVMALCSAALYAIEHGVNQAIASPFDALWWGVVTLSSIGYGDVYPITPEGRIVAMVLMLLGIGLFSTITATITSYLVRTDAPPASGPLVAGLSQLTELRAAGSLTDEEFSLAKGLLLARR